MQNMDLWFGELHTDNVKLSIRVEQQVFHGESEFQHIDVFDSPEFGRFLTSDGSVIFSEKDEFNQKNQIQCYKYKNFKLQTDNLDLPQSK